MEQNNRRLRIKTDSGISRYLIGPEALRTLPDILNERPSLLVVDKKIWSSLRKSSRISVPTASVLLLEGGEKIKTVQSLQTLYEFMAERLMSRDGQIIGIGGGTILDLCGLAASTWNRGIDLISIPTTLLAAVDASIGGKTAINLGDLKNPIGTFHPAAQILMQPQQLYSLPRREWRNGMAEMIKTAVIGSPTLFRELESASGILSDLLAGGHPNTRIKKIECLPWAHWIAAAAKVKIKIVTSDFREAGPRRALNLGHTLGHALELGEGLSHGEAVSLGMAAVSRLSVDQGLCSRKDQKRIVDLLKVCGLPTSLKPGNADHVRMLISRDKKKAGSSIGWILPSKIGQVLLNQNVDIDAALLALAEHR